MKNTIQTKIHFYSFNLDREEDKENWENLLHMLRRELGLKPFTHNVRVNGGKGIVYDNRTEDILLNTEHIFDNQWNGDCESLKNFRVFDWLAYEFDSKNIRCGHWIEPTYETMDIRGQYQCRFCGKIVGYDPGDGFHRGCFSSEYLKEDELYLATVARIYDKYPEQLKKDNLIIPDYVLAEYMETQKNIWTKRLEKANKSALDKIRKDYDNAQMEYNAFMYLNEHGFTDFGNVIFYSRGTFCFGWRHPYNKEAKEKLGNFLELIHFSQFGNYEIKGN